MTECPQHFLMMCVVYFQNDDEDEDGEYDEEADADFDPKKVVC